MLVRIIGFHTLVLVHIVVDGLDGLLLVVGRLDDRLDDRLLMRLDRSQLVGVLLVCMGVQLNWLVILAFGPCLLLDVQRKAFVFVFKGGSLIVPAFITRHLLRNLREC